MKSFLLISQLIIASVALAANPQLAATASEDHLEPMGWNDKGLDAYSQLVESKLGVTAFDGGRAIVYPPFEGEWSVSLYSQQKNGVRHYVVAYVKAEDNLWQRTRALRHPEAARDVKITRTEAELPLAVAEVVREAWRQMLLRAHRIPRISEPAVVEEEYVIGGLHREFAIEQPDRSPLKGQLATTPTSGTATDALVKLVDMLADYCEAASTGRATIADKIDREAKLLLDRLKQA